MATNNLEQILATYPKRMRRLTVPASVLHEAKNRVLDSLGCHQAAFDLRQVSLLRKIIQSTSKGPCQIWKTNKKASPEDAAWINGTAVRALDFNDTYLSKEPCHPSDLLSSIWAACEIRGVSPKSSELLKALVLGYEVMCRLCDAASIRKRGWDHVTYLPIASAVACSYVLRLTQSQSKNAIALATVGNVALRQTRVGTLPDWKAACAAYAARTGLWAARLAKAGFTGPNDIFFGRHGFVKQVSGPLIFSTKPLGSSWKIMKTHVKFFPAEHHSQSAIEAALHLRNEISKSQIQKIIIETFDVSVDIIGSEKEKWRPSTRETADHSLPYLTVVALIDGDVNLRQYKNKRYQDHDVKTLLKKVVVKEKESYSKMYPRYLPVNLIVKLKGGKTISKEVKLPKGYAGNPMTREEILRKFKRNASR